MVLKVETPDGDILTLKETIKKNWKHNGNAILLALGAMITVLTIGNGKTWLLLLAMVSGTVISTTITIIGLICGINSQKKEE